MKIKQSFFLIISILLLSCSNKPEKQIESKPYYDSIEINNPVSTHRYGGYPNGCNQF
jgi:hypothetical protein